MIYIFVYIFLKHIYFSDMQAYFYTHIYLYKEIINLIKIVKPFYSFRIEK